MIGNTSQYGKHLLQLTCIFLRVCHQSARKPRPHGHREAHKTTQNGSERPPQGTKHHRQYPPIRYCSRARPAPSCALSTMWTLPCHLSSHAVPGTHRAIPRPARLSRFIHDIIPIMSCCSGCANMWISPWSAGQRGPGTAWIPPPPRSGRIVPPPQILFFGQKKRPSYAIFHLLMDVLRKEYRGIVGSGRGKLYESA